MLFIGVFFILLKGTIPEFCFSEQEIPRPWRFLQLWKIRERRWTGCRKMQRGVREEGKDRCESAGC